MQETQDSHRLPRSHADQEYLKSDSWRCNDSPTGAHHWMIIRVKNGEKNHKIMTCKYCKQFKKFPVEEIPKLRIHRIGRPKGSKDSEERSGRG